MIASLCLIAQVFGFDVAPSENSGPNNYYLDVFVAFSFFECAKAYTRRNLWPMMVWLPMSELEKATLKRPKNKKGTWTAPFFLIFAFLSKNTWKAFQKSSLTDFKIQISLVGDRRLWVMNLRFHHLDIKFRDGIYGCCKAGEFYN